MRVLRGVGIDPHIFDDPGNRLSLARVGVMLRACVDATGQPHFGLIVASEFELPMLNMLGYLVRHQPTVRAALRTLVLNLHLQDRGAVAALDETGARYAQLSYAVCTPRTPETGLINSTSMMVGFRILKSLCGTELASGRGAARTRRASRCCGLQGDVRFAGALRRAALDDRLRAALARRRDSEVRTRICCGC